MTPPRDSFDGPSGSLGEVLRSLADVVDQSPADAPDEVVRQVVLGLVELSGRLDGELAAWLGVFDAKTMWAGDGSRSAGGWLAPRTELSAKRAAGMASTARVLRSCPSTAAAYRSGVLGTAKVLALVDARAVYPDLFAQHEAGLVKEIAPLTVAHAKVAIARWAALAEATREAEERARQGDDPDPTPPADPVEENRLHLSRTLDGRWVFDAELDPVSGAEEDAAITAEIDRRFADGRYWDGDGLTQAQRRAACHHDLLLRGALAGTRHGDPRPSVSVHVDATFLYGDLIAELDDLTATLRKRCELDDGTPIPVRTAQRLMCNARITTLAERVLADGQIEVLGITDHLRDATATQRKALKSIYGGCVFPGCPAPFDWCQAHHLTPHEDHGPTLLVNLVPLCSHHHHLVHEGGWTLWRHTTGHLHLCRPDGTHLKITRQGHKLTDDQALGLDQPAPPPRPPRRPARPRFPTKRELHAQEHQRQQAERARRNRDDPDERPPPTTQ